MLVHYNKQDVTKAQNQQTKEEVLFHKLSPFPSEAEVSNSKCDFSSKYGNLSHLHQWTYEIPEIRNKFYF